MGARESVNSTLTAVPGVSVGHATDPDAATGCTVVLGPFRAAVDVRGMASGTRQLDALAPHHIAPRVDGFLLTGGSAYGLAAADGVARWLEEAGRGFEVGGNRIAIVPSAVIFDLGVERSDRRPDAEMGREACRAAGTGPVAEGRIGVGAGASVGKILGADRAMPGGVGSWAARFGDHTVGALVVVNAFGDVLDGRGAIIAGARAEGGSFLDTSAYLREHGSPAGDRRRAGSDTTLAVVATDFPLTRTGVYQLARHSMNAVVRRIAPANTQFDGDLVFAGCTAASPEEDVAGDVLRVGVWGEWVLARAIERAVGYAGDAPMPPPD